MARIIYPEAFAAQQTLFSNIYQRHIDLKSKSPLIPFFKQQKIDIEKLQSVVIPAKEQDDLHASQKRSSENSTEKRNANMQLPWKHLIAAVQFLKEFYAGNVRELGEWGITVDGKERIVYPPSFAARAQLIKDLWAKNDSFPPGESPLQVYLDLNPDIVVADDLTMVDDAVTNEADRATAETAALLAIQTRNNLWNPVMTVVHLIGAFLMNLYPDKSYQMGLWGYTVVEETGEEREQISTINPATSRMITSIVIPSVLTNISNVDLQIQKGIDGKGDITILKAGEKLGMIKGFSRITVTNASTLEVGKVQATVRK